MSIVKTIPEIKQVLGRAINTATTPAFILPYVKQAQDTYFLPVLGKAFITELEGSGMADSEIVKEMTPALVWYAYLKYLPFSIGSDGDYGLQEESTEKTGPVRISVLDKRQREAAENASESMERFLKFLFENADDFATWKESDEYAKLNTRWIKTATEMTKYVPQVAKSYRLFLTLIPYLEKVERDRVRAVIGATKFDDLLQKITDDTPLLLEDEKLKVHVQRLVATMGYSYALPFLDIVQVPDGGLKVLSDFDGIYTRKAAEEEAKTRIYALADNEASEAVNMAKKYLKTGASNPNRLPDNSVYNSLFRMK